MMIAVYDIHSDDKRKIFSDTFENYGRRVNLSVFEIFLTKAQFNKLQLELIPLIEPKEDTLIFYEICKDCFSKTIYVPEKNIETDTVLWI